MKTLVIKELTFSAAHYLPGHSKCGCIHGHTYFVRDLVIEYDNKKGFLDIGDIKAVVLNFDHTFIFPRGHYDFWATAIADAEWLSQRFLPLDDIPTVENIGELLKLKFLALPRVKTVSFELYEGPNQGVKIE